MRTELDDLLLIEIDKLNYDENKIHQIIAAGGNINVIDGNDESLLMRAIVNVTDGGSINTVQLLINLGANVNYENEGLNCLHDACVTQVIELVEMLLKAGANPNCVSTDRRKESILDKALLNLNLQQAAGNNVKIMQDIVNLLLQFGAKRGKEIILYEEEF